MTTKKQVTNAATFTTAYTYTAADRLASMTYPSGFVATYTRDSVGRISTVLWGSSIGTPMTLVSATGYYPFGPLNTLTFGNGRVLTKTYDQDYAIDAISSSAAGGLTLDLAVDVMGDITSASGTVNPAMPDRRYLYDPLYRLTTAQTGATPPGPLEAYSYDKTGDRLSASLNGAAATPYSYTTGTHRLASVGSTVRSYDPNGNTQAGVASGFTFAYDDKNRFATATQGSAIYSYQTNGRGERVRKGIGTTYTEYVYDESGQLLGEYNGSGVAQVEYLYLDGVPVGVTTGGVRYYVETDHLGTPRQVIDPARNVAVWTWDALASTFGANSPNPDPTGDGSKFAFNLRFPGQYYDAETGLNYNLARDYEAGTGRYVESDSIGLGGGITTYAYSTSSPLMFTDWSGLSPDCCMRAYQANLFGAYPMGKAPAGGLTVCCDGKLMGCANPFLPNQSTADQIIIRCIKRHEDEHADYQAQPCSNCGVSAPPPTPWIGKPLAECSAAHIEVSCLINSENECRKEGRSSCACLKAIRDRIGSVRRYGDSNMVGCFSR